MLIVSQLLQYKQLELQQKQKDCILKTSNTHTHTDVRRGQTYLKNMYKYVSVYF